MLRGIIVEGTDCSGKSTILRYLSSELSRHGWDTIDLRHRSCNQFDRYIKIYSNYDKILFDRAHFSESVYGELWRGKRPFNKWEYEILNKYVFDNYLIIFVYAPEDILRKRYIERDISQTIEQDELIKVQDSFEKIFKNFSNNVMLYEATSKENLQICLDKVFKILRDHNLLTNEVKKPEIYESKKTGILLEGVNGSGKSTLAKLLKVNMVGWSVKTLDYKTVPPYERYLSEYTSNIETIFDRGHFSEIVYGNIFRNGRHFDSSELKILNDYVNHKMELIFCDPPLETIARRIDEQKYPKHIHKSRINQVRNEFIKALDSSKIPYISIDTSDKNTVESVVKKVKERFSTSAYFEMGWAKPLQSSKR